MKIFLSYPSEQTSAAKLIFSFLKSLGLDVWFDKESLIPGQDWDRERKKAQRVADLTVLICSPETIERAGVIQREVKDILDLINEKPLGQIYVVPVRLEDIRLPPELAKFQYANFFESDWKFQLARAVSYKLTQIEEAEPEQLAAFLKTGQSSESSKKLKSFEESTDVLNCSAEYFTYEKEGIYWDYVNACIVSNVFRGIFDARAEFTGLSETIELKNEWSVNVEEFYRSDELVSLRFFVDWYGSGAAHPNHHAYTMNFVGPVLSQLTLERLFDHSTDVANLLIRYCDHDLKRQHASPDGEIEFLSFPKTAQEAFETFAAFNFDEDGITINLSPYAVLSYAAGFQEVRVPWSSVSAFVSHALRDGPLERLVKRLASDW